MRLPVANRNSPSPGLGRGLHPGLEPFLGALLLFLLVVLVYRPTFWAGFIWDDNITLTNNPFVTGGWDGLGAIWGSRKLPDYFPLTFSSFWLEWRLWGENPIGYHLTNILLHALSAVLLWRLLRRFKVPGAWYAAMLFAIHPVCVASVAWISERKNTLSMFFFLWSLLLYFHPKGGQTDRSADSAAPVGPASGLASTAPGRFYWLSLLIFTLALLAKSSTVVLAPVLLLCVWWQEGQITRRDIFRAAPFFALATLLGLITVSFGADRANGILPGDPHFLTRVLAGGRAVWFYLFHTLAPWELSMIYPRWEPDSAAPLSWVPWLCIAGSLWVGWRFRRTWGRPFLFAFGYSLITLFPVLGFFNMDFLTYSRVADHWQYLSLPGMLAAIVAAACFLFERNEWMRRGLGLTVLIGVATLTFRHQAHFASAENLWRDTLAKNPQAWVALNSLGATLVNQGRVAEGAECYGRALKLNPHDPLSHRNLGATLNLQNKLPEAIAEYEKSLASDPKNPNTHHELAVLLARQKRWEQAQAHFQEAVRIDPANPDTHENFASALAQQRKWQEGALEFAEAIRLAPDRASAYIRLGALYAATQKFEEAIACHREALRREPESLEAMSGLAWLLATTPQPELRQAAQAVALAEAACNASDKPQPFCLASLDAAYAEAGRFTEAVAVAKKAGALFLASGQTNQAKLAEQRLELYQAGKPFHTASP